MLKIKLTGIHQTILDIGVYTDVYISIQFRCYKLVSHVPHSNRVCLFKPQAYVPASSLPLHYWNDLQFLPAPYFIFHCCQCKASPDLLLFAITSSFASCLSPNTLRFCIHHLYCSTCLLTCFLCLAVRCLRLRWHILWHTPTTSYTM